MHKTPSRRVPCLLCRAFVLSELAGAGVQLKEASLPELQQIPRINSKGGLVGAEAYAWHRPLLDQRSELYDPWVLQRFDAGRSQSAAD